MKRIIATLSFVAVSVLLLAGCASVSGSSGTNPVDLTKPSVIASLCGADAASVQATVAKAAAAKPSSGQRHTLVDWGITDPTNDKAVASILSSLKERAAVKDCRANSGKTTYTAAELKAIADSLTISTISASAVCKTDANGLVPPAIDSLLATPPRLWGDAIGLPFTTTDPTAARVELQQTICKDSNVGVAWLTFVATSVRDQLLASTGIDLLVLNPRLKAYTDVSQITPEATAFVPLLNVKVADRTAKLIKKAMTQNLAWQQDAGLVNTLLERYTALGIDTRQSIVNYKLVDYGQNAGAIPVIGINSKPDNRPAQIFALTSKTQCGEIVAFGANTGDKRPELFAAKTCTPPPPPPPTTTTTPSCKVTATHSCTTTHTPGCKTTHSCTPPPTCTVPQKCLTPKNPKNDVAPPQGTTQLGPDPYQPTAPPAKTTPLQPSTPVTADSGLPVGGASPAPSSPAAPSTPATQQPAPTSPGTSIVDPG